MYDELKTYRYYYCKDNALAFTAKAPNMSYADRLYEFQYGFNPYKDGLYCRVSYDVVHHPDGLDFRFVDENILHLTFQVDIPL